MIECGLAIIATCLPVLRHFIADISLESVINSVRSVISLRSMRSSAQDNATTPGTYINLAEGESMRSQAAMVRTEHRRNTRYDEETGHGGIEIKKELSQHSSIL